ncbi:MAG TPA: FAD-dependent oxidoreductase [Gemmatimonadales bacterium]|nr:FAD-dependent oxidoreductase [Gemmatimonadales bacterium]
MSALPDVAIIGAGVVGAACAMRLAQAGLRVVVLDASSPAGGATAAGMGHIVAMDDSPAQLALTVLSRSLLHALADRLPRAVELEWCGTLWIATNEEELAEARRKQALFAGQGIPTELLDDDALHEAEPALRPGLAGALLVPDDGVLYQPQLTRWCLEEARRAGAELRLHLPVTAIGADGVETAGGRVAAGRVLVAAGVDSAELLPGLAIVPRKGHLAVTARRPGFVRHQLVELGYLQSAHTMSAASVAFNVQPRQTGQLLIGSSRELVGRDPAVNYVVLGQMLDRAIAFVPRLDSLEVLRVWTGFRPATADKLPMIGPWPGLGNVWVAAGHEGLGITTALGTAALVEAQMLGRELPLDAAPYRPDRLIPVAEPHG